MLKMRRLLKEDRNQKGKYRHTRIDGSAIYFVYPIFSEVCTAIFCTLLLEQIVFANLTLHLFSVAVKIIAI